MQKDSNCYITNKSRYNIFASTSTLNINVDCVFSPQDSTG